MSGSEDVNLVELTRDPFVAAAMGIAPDPYHVPFSDYQRECDAERAYFAELERKRAAGELKTYDQLREEFNERWPDGIPIGDQFYTDTP